MSAVVDSGDAHEPIQVLFTLHHNMNALDLAGPLEVMSHALHDNNDPESKAFDFTFVGNEEHTMSSSGASFRAQINYKEAHKRLKEFDVLVVPGGNADEVIKQDLEPLDLISAFAELQSADPSRERTILAVSTAALFLAQEGVLQGLSGTTHPDYIIKMENLCQDASARDKDDRTEVFEERYVVNQGRFDLGENLEENPYVFKKGRKISNARKGSLARKQSNARQEYIMRRSSMRLGGLRVITSNSSTAGLDSSLYVVSALVSLDAAQEVARILQYAWIKGVVVDAIDV